MEFSGKRALVTGGSRGIGKAISVALCEAGAKTLQVDLEDWDKTRSIVKNVGNIDILVNNAGYHVSKNFLDTVKESLDKQIDINIKSVFNVSQVVAKSMISRGTGGSIVNISGVRSVKPSPRACGFSICKAGLDMMTKVMALELGPHKIQVNSVNPTYVGTEETNESLRKNAEVLSSTIARHPLGHVVSLSDVTNATLFLLSDKSSMITGTSLFVDVI
ncbi:hypothetical protein KUTeg_013429 [Tegillarca granosa]|uniref:Uncharacterized protein n=1 Tax=Tegillarca granosa TaxID=220873 RepID=A0ABQ9ETR7_TEGGR|nr:hypothetical protein KUTeg_013429 [Tegillarca granosa]